MPKLDMITIFTALSLGALTLVSLNNATSTESLWPLAIVSAAGLIAMGLSQKNSKD